MPLQSRWPLRAVPAALLATLLGCGLARAGGLDGVFTPDGIDVIAVGDSGAIYRSVDAGATWSRSDQGPPALRAVGGSGLTRLIVGDGGRILRSTNSGGAWTTFLAPGAPALLDVAMTGPDTAFAVGEGGTILRSIDGGASWSALASGTAATIRRARFLDPLHGWVVGDSGFAARSTDGGAHWTPAGPATPNALEAVDQRGPRIWIAGENGTCFHSANDGASWTAVDLKLDSRADVRGVVLQGADSVFIAGGGGFIRLSLDDGATWSFQRSPLLGEVADVAFAGAHGFVASPGAQAVLRTLDRGQTWDFPPGTSVTRDWVLKQPLLAGIQRGRSFGLNPVRRSTIYAGIGSRFYVSRDDGETWTQFASLPGGFLKINAFLVSPRDSSEMVCAAAPPGTLLHSSDGGATWTTTLTHAFGEYGIPLEMDPDRPDTILFGGNADSLLRSTDFGKTWAPYGAHGFRSPCVIRIVPGSDSAVVLVGDGVTGSGNGEVWRSTDGGLSFQRTLVGPGDEIPGIAVGRLRNDVAYATTWSSGGLYQSVDDGLQWSAIQSTPYAWGVDVAADDPDVVVYGSYGAWIGYLSLDGGASFASQGLPTANFGVYARDRACILAEQDVGLYKLVSSYAVVPNGTQTLQLTAPSGGEIWRGGTIQTIAWVASGVALARIEYRLSDLDPWRWIADVPGYLGAYAWLVPLSSTTTARVRVSDAWDGAPADSSAAGFAIDATTGVPPAPAATFALPQNQPNPFAGRTRIRYSLARAADVSLEVFDIRGERVATLARGAREAGTHEVVFTPRRADGAALASGVYLVRLRGGGFVATRKMLLLR